MGCPYRGVRPARDDADPPPEPAPLRGVTPRRAPPAGWLARAPRQRARVRTSGHFPGPRLSQRCFWAPPPQASAALPPRGTRPLPRSVPTGAPGGRLSTVRTRGVAATVLGPGARVWGVWGQRRPEHPRWRADGSRGRTFPWGRRGFGVMRGAGEGRPLLSADSTLEMGRTQLPRVVVEEIETATLRQDRQLDGSAELTPEARPHGRCKSAADQPPKGRVRGQYLQVRLVLR